MVQLEDVASTAPRARGLTLPAQYRLSQYLFWAEKQLIQFCAEKQRIQLAVPQHTRK